MHQLDVMQGHFAGIYNAIDTLLAVDFVGNFLTAGKQVGWVEAIDVL